MNYSKVLQITSNVGYTNLVAISSVVVYDLAEFYCMINSAKYFQATGTVVYNCQSIATWGLYII